ncbi:AraC family transcriptional regulator [Myceligenerans crystallogenes]|uniref:AraC-type DNA-binding protein n=1 Tax=Myceligenerans crystallogenes TaxID=316335 RepID=A0ABN2NEE7_9MICO
MNVSDDAGWPEAKALLDALSPAMVALMDELTGVMFCAKDAAGRYVLVNEVFVARTRERSRRDVVGRRAPDLFVAELAERYEEQDDRVRGTGRPLRGELELIRHAGGAPGWFLTSKLPVSDDDGRFVGLVSVSQDLRSGDADDATIRDMARLRHEIEARLELGDVPTAGDLAALSGYEPGALERRVRRVFGISPRQLVLRLRLDRATHLLTSTTVPLAQIATAAGFADQPSFTRTFARVTGETPAAFRRRSTAARPPA